MTPHTSPSAGLPSAAVVPVSTSCPTPKDKAGLAGTFISDDNNRSSSLRVTTGDPDAACAGKSSRGGVEGHASAPRTITGLSCPLWSQHVACRGKTWRTAGVESCPRETIPGTEAIERDTSSIASGRSFRNVKYANTSAILAASGIQVSSLITAFIERFVMRSVYEEKVARASKNARMIVQGDARVCSALNFGKVCKALWPFKTAEELAALVGCSVRAAAYEISGEREPSAQSILAVMNAIIPKRERT